MADQPARLEAATVRAEVGSNIVYRFANDAASAADIPTLSGEIPNLSKIILTIQQEGADKISFSTRIYQTTAAGIAATSDQEIFLVQTDDPDEIYAVWQNVAGAAVDTGKRSLSAAAVIAATQAASDAATAAQESADDATARVARFLAPSSVEPIQRDNGQPLEVGDQWPNSSNGLVYNWNGTGWVPLNESVQGLVTELADPANRIVAWKRETLNSQIGTVGQVLNGVAPSPWEYAHLVTDRPDGGPSMWDWAPAINEALRLWGYVELPMGSLGIASPINYKPGMVIRGKGPGNAGGFEYSEVYGSTLRVRADFAGEYVLYGKASSPENVLTAPQFEQLRLDLSKCGAHGIVLEDVYDGCTLYNVHITGTEKTRRGLWFKRGSYGLGQTVFMANCQIMGRDNTDGVVAPFFAEALNESNFIGCKFFGSMGGVNASNGPAAEFAGCSGQTNIGCSYAFADAGILILHAEEQIIDGKPLPGRKTIGFDQLGCSYEALKTTGTKVRGTAALMSTQITVQGPRYYDSVFTFANAVDVDFCEQSEFQCHFKHAIVDSGADQNVVYAQRQNYLTDRGTNTTVISHPNASDPYYGINKRFRATGGLTSVDTLRSESALAQRVSTYTAESAKIPSATRVVIVDRSTIGRYELPKANAMGAGFTAFLTVKSIGAGSVELSRESTTSDTVNGSTSITIASRGSVELISDGVSAWFTV